MIIRPRGARHLDYVLASWSSVDPWSVRDACGNTLITGRTGSGKSSGAGDHCLRAVVRHRNSGGLILDQVGQTDAISIGETGFRPEPGLCRNPLDRGWLEATVMTKGLCSIIESV
jgi:hypothetical protein